MWIWTYCADGFSSITSESSSRADVIWLFSSHLSIKSGVASTTSDKLIRTSTGRFDFHVELRALAIPEREALLKHQVEEHGLQCSEEVISEIASKCDGYDAYDLVMFPFM